MSPKPTPLRRLGRNGPLVPALGFGLMSLAGAFGPPPTDEERFKLLDRALELGETFWDTSDAYGDNEEMVGKWFLRTGKRDKIFLASKFGVIRAGPEMTIDNSAEYCRKACEASLKKLGVDCIDLYYVHRVDPAVPIEATMRAMLALQKEGKIKHIGLSEVSSTTLRRAYKIAPVAAVQTEYSPFVLEIESSTGTHILQTCRDLGVSVICYRPLGRGLLAGAFTSKELVKRIGDFRPAHFPRFAEENLEANLAIVEGFRGFAEKKGVSCGQLALAWLLKQGDEVIPIPGTKSIKYLEENWGSLDVQLSDEEEAEIREFFEHAEVKGYRSLPSGIEDVYMDTKEEV